MCIADLNPEMQGRYASSADMTVWSVLIKTQDIRGHVAGVEKRVRALLTLPFLSSFFVAGMGRCVAYSQGAASALLTLKL